MHRCITEDELGQCEQVVEEQSTLEPQITLAQRVRVFEQVCHVAGTQRSFATVRSGSGSLLRQIFACFTSPGNSSQRGWLEQRHATEWLLRAIACRHAQARIVSRPFCPLRLAVWTLIASQDEEDSRRWEACLHVRVFLIWSAAVVASFSGRPGGSFG